MEAEIEVDTSFRHVRVRADHQRRGAKRGRNTKGWLCELASDVTCFLMRGNLGIRNLAV